LTARRFAVSALLQAAGDVRNPTSQASRALAENIDESTRNRIPWSWHEACHSIA
jgi:hypothetical protein